MDFLHAYHDGKVSHCLAGCGSVQFALPRPMYVADNPYLECLVCGAWTQHPAPEHRYESEETEHTAHLMGDAEKAANAFLAKSLHDYCQPSTVLDVGSRYPYLLKCFKDLGVKSPTGIDNIRDTAGYAKMLGVECIVGDFLGHSFTRRTFDLVTMVHVIEHFTSAYGALRKAQRLTSPGGHIFIRTPDITSGSIASHLSPAHYPVHPVLFSPDSFARIVQDVGEMEVAAFSQSERSASFDVIIRNGG